MSTLRRAALILFTFLGLCFSFSGTQASDTLGYLVDSRGNVVKNSYGECWRTGYWTPALAIAECDPDFIKKAAPEPVLASPPAKAAPPAKSEVTEPQIVVDVFYGTDRVRTEYVEPNKFYGEFPSSSGLEYGVCKVTIPATHVIGEVESPFKLWVIQFAEDETKHIVLKKIIPMSKEAFLERLGTAATTSKSKAIFVFVHGYNVSFKDAARRAAQMAVDLKTVSDDKSFDILPAIYSWPSRASTINYPSDEENVKLTVRNLKTFLGNLVSLSGIKDVHIIAHSMGNRAVTDALVEMARERRGKKDPIFKQIVLAAPDIYAELFKQEIAPKIIGSGSRVTLYASSKDKALVASKKEHGGHRRAGESGPGILVVRGIDTIDASNVDLSMPGYFDVDRLILRHSYFAEARPVIKDIADLFRVGAGPEKRNLLKQGKKAKYWAFP